MRVRAFAIILLVTLAVRLPFFFPAVIDWDESTFILIGQSILDGHLPYVHLWDVKPPLLFAFFSGAIAVFGHSILAIRIAGALCVAATAWFVFLIAARWWSPPAAWSAAILSVLVSSLLASGQATMSEHIALPLLMGATYLWMRGPRSITSFFSIGCLMAASTLVRLNLIYAVLAIGLLIAIGGLRRRPVAIQGVAAFATGGLALVVLVCLPFLAAGETELLWKSAVLAALARSDPAGVTGERLAELLRAGFFNDGSGIFWQGASLWLGALAGSIVVLTRSPRHATTAEFGSLLGVAAAVGVSIAMSGGAYPHYLIQLVPFAAIAAAALIEYPPRGARAAIWILMSVASLASLRPVATEYREVMSRLSSGSDLKSGPAYDLATYLGRENPDRRPVLLFTDHLVYWLTRSEPPVPLVTHPSTLSRGNVLAVMGTSAGQELRRIFERKPLFVVLDPGERFLDDGAQAWFDSTLAADYVVAGQMSGRDIYRRVGR